MRVVSERVASAACRAKRVRDAINPTQTPTARRSNAVSTSSALSIFNDRYGFVNQKSNGKVVTSAERAPAFQPPVTAASTTTRTSTSATFATTMSSRSGTKIAATASGRSAPIAPPA